MVVLVDVQSIHIAKIQSVFVMKISLVCTYLICHLLFQFLSNFLLNSLGIPPNCDFVNPCNDEPCFNGGTCHITDQSGNFTCICPFEFTGPLCQININCPQLPCLNGGTCSRGVCICPQGLFTFDILFQH